MITLIKFPNSQYLIPKIFENQQNIKQAKTKMAQKNWKYRRRENSNSVGFTKKQITYTTDVNVPF